MIDLSWTKDNEPYLTQKVSVNVTKSKYDPLYEICGHFPVYDGTHLNLFFGAVGHDGWTYNNSLDYWHMPESNIPQRFNQDASSVRVGNYFWLFGGTKKCGAYRSITFCSFTVNNFKFHYPRFWIQRSIRVERK